MALPHAPSGAVIDVQAGGLDLSTFSSIALAKSEELELIRMVLPAGKSIPEHHVPGEVTMLCLEGEVAVECHGENKALGKGQMMYLNGGQAHAIRGVQNAVLLRTIVLASTGRH